MQNQVIQSVRNECLSYLSDQALQELSSLVSNLEAGGTKGILIEAGCALGGSALVMASAKSPSRPFFVYDVFGMIPPPSDRDGEDVHKRYEVIRSGCSRGIEGNTYYGYQENLFEKVKQRFARYGFPLEQNNIHLIQGRFEHTVSVTSQVALAHIDCDWYESVMTCLQRIEPNLAPNGLLVIDDYDDWSGCRAAVDEYFAARKDRYKFVFTSRLHIMRT